jgi:hypothetical protein
MWLLNTSNHRLELVLNPQDVEYAILSHTWGVEEVTFEDMKEPDLAIRKFGYHKILKTCQQALKDGVHYAWIDACCIDKSSSAELSEAINSMFRWYQLAKFCYAFLEDYDLTTDRASLAHCKWFTRGWTLQELIAPSHVFFMDRNWQQFGSRYTLSPEISAITHINLEVLQDITRLRTVPAGRRMSWAAYRKTTRVEDRAYSLLGIFGVNMPLLYGEGERAFLRLQEEIGKDSMDLSLFAWQQRSSQPHPSEPKPQPILTYWSLYSPAPEMFGSCGDLVWDEDVSYDAEDYSMTEKGLVLPEAALYRHYPLFDEYLWFATHYSDTSRGKAVLPLWCHHAAQPGYSIAMPLLRARSGYARCGLEASSELLLYHSPFGNPRITVLGDRLNLAKHLVHVAISASKHEGIHDQVTILKSVMATPYGSLWARIGNAGKLTLEVSVSIKTQPRRDEAFEAPGHWRLSGLPAHQWNGSQCFVVDGGREFTGVLVLGIFSGCCQPVKAGFVCGHTDSLGGWWAHAIPLGDFQGTRKTFPGPSEPQDVELARFEQVNMFRDIQALLEKGNAITHSRHRYWALRELAICDSAARNGGIPSRMNMNMETYIRPVLKASCDHGARVIKVGIAGLSNNNGDMAHATLQLVIDRI